MFQLLRAPYPFYPFSVRRAVGIVGVGLFIALFLIFFQPFDTSESAFPNKNLFLAGYGVLVAVSILLLDFILRKKLYDEATESNWTVGKQILTTTFYLVVAISNCYLYKKWFFNESINLFDFGYFMLLGFSIALFPICITVLLDYIFKLQKNQATATKINNTRPLSGIRTVEENPIILTAENGKDEISVLSKHLLYLQSADNYVEIITVQDDQLQKALLRGTLSSMEKQIKDDKIQRCHRSFVVNLDRVESVSGNAQGYKLHLPHDQLVPVARSKSKNILAAL